MTSTSNPQPKSKQQQMASKQVVRIVFFALLLDLLAFTIPLPLFPRLINSFVLSESAQSALSPTLLSRTLSLVRHLRSLLFSYSPVPPSAAAEARWDLTLLGGLLASGFSLCQFVISPRLGAASDKWGRRRVLLASMVGNLVSGVLWVGASSFGIYSASRLIAGLSEGNVQLSIAVISDVTSEKERSRALALVGVAFSLAFTLGPSLGAYFASRPLSSSSTNTNTLPLIGTKLQLNSYATPALVTLVLLSVETLYLYLRLPETRWWVKEVEEAEEKKESEVEGKKAGQEVEGGSKEQRQERLRELQWLHLGFLFFFSGAEFTLTFLTYTLFDYTNAQNGRLLGFIGILSSLLQGGYVRRLKSTPSGPLRLARSGIYTCVLSLLLLTLLPHLGAMGTGRSQAGVVLYLAAAGLAFVSATVVNSLNALASLQTGAEGLEKERGAALGRFRSRGQLGRALGPLVATVVYWVWGPSACYAMGCVGMVGMAARVTKLGRRAGVQATADLRRKKEL